jgi:hypothetical protein
MNVNHWHDSYDAAVAVPDELSVETVTDYVSRFKSDPESSERLAALLTRVDAVRNPGLRSVLSSIVQCAMRGARVMNEFHNGNDQCL